MTDHDRGAYTPQTDAPLAFDARQSRGGGGGSPTTLIISGVVLAALVVAVVLFYRGGVRAPNEAPQPVGEPIGAMKSAPPAEAQPAPPCYAAASDRPGSAAPAQPRSRRGYAEARACFPAGHKWVSGGADRRILV
jgi:hypothetical protein